jgi:hypothetical protein
MDFLIRMALKKIRQSLEDASPEKLTEHYNTLTRLYMTLDDGTTKPEILELQADIKAEANRRGCTLGPIEA